MGPLADGDVHVWLSLPHAPARSPGAHPSIAGRVPQAVRHDVAVRLAARYLEVPASRVTIAPDDDGRPVLLVHGKPAPLALSLADSGAAIAIALSRANAVGVDIEGWDDDLEADAILRRFFQPAERRWITERGRAAFFDAWVAREALLKAGGMGLSGLRDVELAFDAEGVRALRVPIRLGDASSWTIRAFACGPRRSGAVATRSPGGELRVGRLADLSAHRL